MTILGGIFIAKGYLSDSELTTIVAGLCTLIGVCWSAYSKIQMDKKLQAQGTEIPSPETDSAPTVPGGEWNPKAEVRRAIEKDQEGP